MGWEVLIALVRHLEVPSLHHRTLSHHILPPCVHAHAPRRVCTHIYMCVTNTCNTKLSVCLCARMCVCVHARAQSACLRDIVACDENLAPWLLIGDVVTIHSCTCAYVCVRERTCTVHCACVSHVCMREHVCAVSVYPMSGTERSLTSHVGTIAPTLHSCKYARASIRARTHTDVDTYIHIDTCRFSGRPAGRCRP